jgi:DNA-binding GntR family transcriptional regulator
MQKRKSALRKQALSASEQAYNGIIDLVLHHELRAGERTSVNQLAERLNLGRTPVKEAITRLQTEGLLSVAGRSGTVVNQINRQETKQLFALRRTLEDFAADDAVKNVTAEQLRRLRQLTQDMHPRSFDPDSVMRSTAEFVRANVEFHALIIAATGNHFLLRIYSQIQIQLQIVTYLVHRGYDPRASERRQREHEEILKAMTARDSKQLKVALRAHARTTEEAILETIKVSRSPAERIMALV